MLRAGQVLQLSVAALLGLAVVMVLSAGMTMGEDGFEPMSMVRSRPAMYAVASIVLMWIGSRVNLRRVVGRLSSGVNVVGSLRDPTNPGCRSRSDRPTRWRNPAPWLLALSLILVAATLIPGVGLTINGAQRWLPMGPASWGLTFQPSELVKWTMVIAVACWCARREQTIKRFWTGLAPAMVLIAVACGLIVIEDLGTAGLIALVAGVVLLAGGARLWQMALMAVPAAAALYIAVTQSQYRMARIMSFLDPWQDPRGSGYQAIQSMVAIANGGPAGRGLGNGVQKFDYLPADTTDFIFAVICEEMGIAGAAMVVGLFLVLIWTGLGIVRSCRDTFGRLVALGVTMTVGFQALINLAVVVVVVPTKGIALPLLSSGGTGWMVTAFALGLVAGLERGGDGVIEDNDSLPRSAAPTSPAI